MRIAYVDSSCLIAVALQEEGAGDLLVRLSGFDRLVSSPLAEAEFRSALVREEVPGKGGNLLSWLDWIQPYLRLTPEIEQILALGRLAVPTSGTLLVLCLRGRSWRGFASSLGMRGRTASPGPSTSRVSKRVSEKSRHTANAVG